MHNGSASCLSTEQEACFFRCSQLLTQKYSHQAAQADSKQTRSLQIKAEGKGTRHFETALQMQLQHTALC